MTIPLWACLLFASAFIAILAMAVGGRFRRIQLEESLYKSMITGMHQTDQIKQLRARNEFLETIHRQPHDRSTP